MRRPRSLYAWFAAFVVLLAAPCVLAAEVKEPRGGPAALFAIEDPTAPAEKLLFVYHEASMQLTLLRADRGALRQVASAPALGRVWAATTFRSGETVAIAVAYGFSREQIDAPIRVILYDLGLTTPRTIFERGSSRSQTTALRQIDDALFITFFDSKYHTQAALLQPTQTGPFSFQGLFRTRLGMALDWDGQAWVIGRPYPDPDLKQPELLLRRDDTWVPLPSTGGVSAVAFFRPAKAAPAQILVGDGWDQHYAKKAKARLSLLSYDPQRKRYTHKLIATAPPQIRINKIVPLVLGKQSVVLAAGETFIDAHYPAKRWKKRRLHQTRSKDPLTSLDFAILGVQSGALLLAVYDGELTLLKVPLTP